MSLHNTQSCRAAADDAPEDINAELGVGAVTADLQLDATKEAAEAQIVAAAGALGRYAPFVAAFCRSGYASQRNDQRQALHSAPR